MPEPFSYQTLNIDHMKIQQHTGKLASFCKNDIRNSCKFLGSCVVTEIVELSTLRDALLLATSSLARILIVLPPLSDWAGCSVAALC